MTGIAYGRLFLYTRKEEKLTLRKVEDVDAELARFKEAQDKADQQLEHLCEKARIDVGEEEAQIFEAHRLLLKDAGYVSSITKFIRERHANAEYAVSTTAKRLASVLEQSNNFYMKERAIDILDISDRIERILLDIPEGEIGSDEPIILFAKNLSPSETMKMDKSKILAFITREGSANSHTAILADAMDIPAIVQSDIEIKSAFHGKLAIVDGFTGEIFIEPDEEVEKRLLEKRRRFEIAQQELKLLCGKENITTDGRRIDIVANIEKPQDVQKVLEYDAGGIGLFRSEYLYLGRNDLPSEELLYKNFCQVLNDMGEKPVTIRTVDIGADKEVDYLHLKREENPALGGRGVRLCLNRPDIFKTQLRAIYRASVFGNLSVMIPMINSVEEIQRVKGIIKEVWEELRAENLEYKEIPLGIMIETPAAAFISDQLAKEVDFFSIGTNDLTQYMLAIDRMNPDMEKFYNPYHNAIIRMITHVVKNAHKAGIKVGICGQLASDVRVTRYFLDAGVDELSVPATQVLKVRKKVREI